MRAIMHTWISRLGRSERCVVTDLRADKRCNPRNGATRASDFILIPRLRDQSSRDRCRRSRTRVQQRKKKDKERKFHPDGRECVYVSPIVKPRATKLPPARYTLMIYEADIKTACKANGLTNCSQVTVRGAHSSNLYYSEDNACT